MHGRKSKRGKPNLLDFRNFQYWPYLKELSSMQERETFLIAKQNVVDSAIRNAYPFPRSHYYDKNDPVAQQLRFYYDATQKELEESGEWAKRRTQQSTGQKNLAGDEKYKQGLTKEQKEQLSKQATKIRRQIRGGRRPVLDTTGLDVTVANRIQLLFKEITEGLTEHDLKRNKQYRNAGLAVKYAIEKKHLMPDLKNYPAITENQCEFLRFLYEEGSKIKIETQSKAQQKAQHERIKAIQKKSNHKRHESFKELKEVCGGKMPILDNGLSEKDQKIFKIWKSYKTTHDKYEKSEKGKKVRSERGIRKRQKINEIIQRYSAASSEELLHLSIVELRDIRDAQLYAAKRLIRQAFQTKSIEFPASLSNSAANWLPEIRQLARIYFNTRLAGLGYPVVNAQPDDSSKVQEYFLDAEHQSEAFLTTPVSSASSSSEQKVPELDALTPLDRKIDQEYREFAEKKLFFDLNNPEDIERLKHYLIERDDLTALQLKIDAFTVDETLDDENSDSNPFIIMAAPGCGLGLFAAGQFDKGEPIAPYDGEIFGPFGTKSAVEEALRKWSGPTDYVLQYKDTATGQWYLIDAREKKCLTAFINDVRPYNAVIKIVCGRPYVVATAKIIPGMQLSVNYSSADPALIKSEEARVLKTSLFDIIAELILRTCGIEISGKDIRDSLLDATSHSEKDTRDKDCKPLNAAVIQEWLATFLKENRKQVMTVQQSAILQMTSEPMPSAFSLKKSTTAGLLAVLNKQPAQAASQTVPTMQQFGASKRTSASITQASTSMPELSGNKRHKRRGGFRASYRAYKEPTLKLFHFASSVLKDSKNNAIAAGRKNSSISTIEMDSKNKRVKTNSR
jgi:hypothetical protein